MDEIILILKTASQGLLYMSESDYPFEVVYFEGDGKKELSDKELLELLGESANAPLEKVELTHFFRNMLVERNDASAEEKAIVKKYLHLRNTLVKLLDNIKVYRVGQIEIKAYVLGITAGGSLAGVKTKVIET